jgi:hypothetical protein
MANVVDTQVGVDGSGTGTIALSSFASNALAGDAIVVSVVWFNDTAGHIGDAGNAPTDNKSNTYVKVGTIQGPNNTGGLAYTQVFWLASNVAAGATNVTLHGTAGALRLGIASLCTAVAVSPNNGDYAGTNFTSFLSTATFPQTTVTPPANSLFFSSMFRHAIGTSTAPGGWSTADRQNWATNAHIVMSHIVASAKQTPVWSIPDTDYWSGGTFSLAPLPPNPTPTSVAPVTGATVGGEQVTVTGTNFTADTTITFGGVAATGVIFDSVTQIRCTPAAHAVGSVDVITTNSFGTGATLVNGYTYAVRPIPVSIMPQYGLNGHLSSVTIKGSGFVNGLTVTFDGTPATSIVVVDSSTITCTPPAHADGTAVVTVTNP